MCARVCKEPNTERFTMADQNNPIGLMGIEFTEYATPDSDYMDKIFTEFGFSKLKKFKGKDIV